MERPDICPDCGASVTAYTGSYCQKCGTVLLRGDITVGPNLGSTARKPGDAADHASGDMSERRRGETSRVSEKCADQDWLCAYPCAGNGHGRPLLPGERVALAYDGSGIIHLECAMIGTVPLKGNPHVSDPFVAHGDGS